MDGACLIYVEVCSLEKKSFIGKNSRAADDLS